jgi:stage II sporulation protein D (peptidoglycan lytic transglycosylase)
MRINHLTLKGLTALMALLVFSGTLHASEIRVGLFYQKEITDVVFSVVDGEYIIYGDYRQVGAARKGFIYHIGISADALTIQDTSAVLGTFGRIEFKGVSGSNVFSIRPVSPALPSKELDDNLLLVGELGLITAINLLDLEKYIAGVVESEGGPAAQAEFYKAQAILARTFAVKNFYRHGTEGYNLCDAEHCQSYKGKSRMNPDIPAAALATKALILFDTHNNPVNPPYHSNCGGRTCDAAWVWGQPLNHLKPVTDPFCRDSRNAAWDLILGRDEWISYLQSKGFRKEQLLQADLNFLQDTRQKYYRLGDRQVELVEIRKDLALKSAWFSVAVKGDSVILRGKGYGHGVGMCQEGAMKMAEKGYVFVDILHFYFKDVIIGHFAGKGQNESAVTNGPHL